MDIHINLLLIIIILFAVMRVLHGNRVGLTGEVKTVTGLFMSVIIMVLLIFLFIAITSNQQLRIILTGILLFAASLLYKILKSIIKPVELLAELPLIETFDQLLGILAGLVETLLIIWAFSTLIYHFDLGNYGAWMRNQVGESQILTFLFRNNVLGMIVSFVYNTASQYITL